MTILGWIFAVLGWVLYALTRWFVYSYAGDMQERISDLQGRIERRAQYTNLLEKTILDAGLEIPEFRG
jgi:hypothetical protein